MSLISKILAIFLLLVIAASSSNAQYYLRGQINDDLGRALPNVKINLFSKGNYSYRSGNSGGFGIPTPLEIDTITLSLVGYETLKKAVVSKQYQNLVLKMLPATASLMKNKLSSITKNLLKEQFSFFNANVESYTSLIENDFVNTKKYPETGFSLNIDRASYSNARRFLNNDINVPTDAVRIEEMLNYFDFRSPNEILKEKEFLMNQYVTSCPWNSENRLLFLKLNAPKLNLENVPPSNLVFLIDVSGSMDKPNRLPLLQSAFKMLTDNLRAIDTVSIIIYGGGVARILDPTSGAEKVIIKNVIDSLTASGDTPGEAAIQTAYASARSTFIKGGNNRVILATDGDFNIGITSEKSLEDLIAYQVQSGIYLTCLGVGMGNYKDSKLETLAKKGNGNFAYIDNIYEAQKVLVTEFTKTLYAVANDAYLNINFNEAAIKNYRLIGFDNKRTSIEDSTSELEGGEVGSGHTLIAIFEINPTNQNIDSTTLIGNAILQYKLPNSKENTYQQLVLKNNTINLDNADKNLRFATSVAMFGSLLKKSKYAENYNFSDVYKLAETAAKPNDYAQQEFLRLLQKAHKLYGNKKKR
jgi:Ca-activated chloride channel family protein